MQRITGIASRIAVGAACMRNKAAAASTYFSAHEIETTVLFYNITNMPHLNHFIQIKRRFWMPNDGTKNSCLCLTLFPYPQYFAHLLWRCCRDRFSNFGRRIDDFYLATHDIYDNMHAWNECLKAYLLTFAVYWKPDCLIPLRSSPVTDPVKFPSLLLVYRTIQRRNRRWCGALE